MNHKHHKKPPRRIASKGACPHCGSPYNFGMRIGDWDEIDTRYHVACAVCGATGPTAETRHEAVTAWEHRAQPIPLSEADAPEEFREESGQHIDPIG